jgi:hypothetical protein
MWRRFCYSKPNISVISSLVKEQLGNMTFQEAYEKTRRVLNVIIPFEGGKRSVLMNFLTTPNVVCIPPLVVLNHSLYGLPLSQAILKEASQAFGAMWEFFAKMKPRKSSLGIAMVFSPINLNWHISVGQDPYTSRLNEPFFEK